MDPSPSLDRIRRALRRALGLRSLRAHVVVLVLVCIIPMVGFSAFAVLRYASAQRAADDRQVLNTARALSSAMDVELKTAESALAALATSPALRDSDFAEFYAQAQQVAIRHQAWVVLVEPSGRVLFNTRRPMEGPPRYLKSSDLAGLAAATRTTQISNVFYGAREDGPQVSIFFPVIAHGEVTHVLMMSYDLEELNHVLLDQDLPPNWWVMVVDREHRIILRNRNLERHAGELISDSLIEPMSKAGDAAYTEKTFKNVPVSMAFAKSAYTGWTLAAIAPLADTAASLRTSLQEIGVVAAAMLFLGLLFAGAVGGRMARELRRLSSSALALGHGSAIPSTRTDIAEVDGVLGALDTAAARLQRRSRERDEAERSLRQSEQRFRDIAETAADWIWETDRSHRFTYFSGTETSPSGPGARQTMGMTRWEFAGGDAERDEPWRQHKADLEARRSFRDFHYSFSRDGRRIHYVASGKPVFDESGEFLGYRGTAINETEVVEARRRAEEAETLLQDAIDSISEGFVIFDRDDRLVMFNERYREFYDPTLSRLHPGTTFEEILRSVVAHEEIPEAVGREGTWLADRLRRHREAEGAFEQRLGDGRWLLITERRMRNGGTAGLRIDITALKQAQAALRESEERLDRAQRIAHIGSWELDLVSGAVAWSKEMYRMRGLSPDQLLPTPARAEAYTHPDDIPAVAAWIEGWKTGRHPPALEYRIRRSDGAVRHVRVEGEPTMDSRGNVVKVSGTMQDVTEMREADAQRRALEDQLHHSQKLEALGTLAGGIAHDLNNTLVPVVAMAKLGLKRAAPQSALRESFELIYLAGLRARDLVKQVLAFSRKESVDRQRFRMHEVVNEALAMLRSTVPATIAIEREIHPVPPILGDPSQLHQIVVNLMTNAVHAIGTELGTITVTVGVLPGATRGEPNFIRLSMRDSGCGMDEATQKRIFDPFFTTKGVGEGTGLGLSVVHGIVAGHGGKIRVESQPGGGSRFVIDLPLVDEPAAMEDAVPA